MRCRRRNKSWRSQNQAVRQIDEAEERKLERNDIVEHVKLTLQKHPASGWAIVVILAFSFIATVANRVFGILKTLGVIG